jgi:hypothetical protein
LVLMVNDISFVWLCGVRSAVGQARGAPDKELYRPFQLRI